MPTITETTVQEIARISGVGTYGYITLRAIERRDQYEWDNPEVPVFVDGSSRDQEWEEPRYPAAYYLASVRAALEDRDDFALSPEEQATVDQVTAETADDPECRRWATIGRTRALGTIRGVQRGTLTSFSI